MRKFLIFAILIPMVFAGCSKEEENVLPEKPAEPQKLNNVEYVKMGDLLWATKNVGASSIAGSPETCYGDYFAWSETSPRYTKLTYESVNKIVLSWPNGKNVGYSYSYSPESGASDISGIYCDVARLRYSYPWRIPRKSDFDNLVNACGGAYGGYLPTGDATTSQRGIYWCDNYNGVSGVLFCDGSNTLFFPAAGHIENTSIVGFHRQGRYWMSELESYKKGAYAFAFSEFTNFAKDQVVEHYFGCPIRPVANANH